MMLFNRTVTNNREATMPLNQFNRNYSVTLKIIIIFIMVILFLIPTFMIESLIKDRNDYKNDALKDISSKWGKEQRIGNIVLYLPVVDDKNINYIRILPETLTINSQVDPEIRYRGIFKFVFYKGTFDLSGTFSLPDFRNYNITKTSILFDKAFIQYEITDQKGIYNDLNFTWNGLKIEPEPGIKSTNLINNGITAYCPALENNSFQLKFSLRGSEALYFYPNGKISKTSVFTKWDNISYDGAFLPEKKQDQNGSIKADWNISSFNRNYSQVSLESKTDINENVDQLDYTYGIKYLNPVDVYKQTSRAIKYEILFVALTFILIFIIELTTRKRIHPFQYILIGFALIIFYLLLLSISEHFGFAIAYMISSLCIISMISLYSLKILKNIKFSILVLFVLSLLYVFLYILLINQDYSLLIGSIGLLVILAGIMYLTRNISWYNTEES